MYLVSFGFWCPVTSQSSYMGPNSGLPWNTPNATYGLSWVIFCFHSKKILRNLSCVITLLLIPWSYEGSLFWFLLLLLLLHSLQQVIHSVFNFFHFLKVIGKITHFTEMKSCRAAAADEFLTYSSPMVPVLWNCKCVIMLLGSCRLMQEPQRSQ